ncbi:MAG: D-alanyl-D-alanine carboxypeptidase family protein [Caulobacterales bacterium]
MAFFSTVLVRTDLSSIARGARRTLALAVFVGGVASAAVVATAAEAQAQERYSAIVIDLSTHEVLHQDEADDGRFPASLTKMMTLYMLFEALDAGEVSLTTGMSVSRAASRQPPSRLGLRRGETITVEDAIQALAARSANDVATVVAERLGGTESRFAQRMTDRARALGMTETRFANASGLPDERHRTTARDMATLSEALIRDFPQYYHYFQTEGFSWRNRYGGNHNRLLNTVPGVDGIKTGYTRASGFNLATSAVRDGRRLIVVVLGGESSAARNAEVEHLLEAAYEELRRREIEAGGGQVSVARLTSAPWRGGNRWTEDGEIAEGDSDDQDPTAAQLETAAANAEPVFNPQILGPVRAGTSLPPLLPERAIRR